MKRSRNKEIRHSSRPLAFPIVSWAMKRARIGTRTDRQSITILLLLRPDGDGLHLLQKSRRHRLNCLLLARDSQMVQKYATRFNRRDL